MRDRLTARRWRVALPAALLTLAVVATACGDDDDGTATPGATSTAGANDALLGPENKATGEPIVIGFLSEGKGTTIDNSEEIDAAKAAAAYVNNHLGGVAGRPLQIEVCELHNVAATAKNCASQMVRSKAVALAIGASGVVDTVIDVSSPAKLPLFNAVVSTQKGLTKPYVYSLTNGIGVLAGAPAYHAKQVGAKKVAVIVVDVPAASGPVTQLGRLVFGNAGAQVEPVLIAHGTADHTPQIQAAISKKADMFHIIGDSAFCTSTLKAMRTLNVTVPIVAIPQCVGDNNAAQIPRGFEGIKIAGSFTIDTDDPDHKLMQAGIAKYGKGEFTGTAPTGWQSILGLARALSGLTGEVTRESVNNAIKAMQPQDIPLGVGAKFQCNGKQVALGPNICTTSALIGDGHEDGSVDNFQQVDVAPFLKLPAS